MNLSIVLMDDVVIHIYGLPNADVYMKVSGALKILYPNKNHIMYCIALIQKSPFDLKHLG